MKGTDIRTCYACGGRMEPSTTSVQFQFRGKKIEIKGIDAYTCQTCGEKMYSYNEAQMIEKLVLAINEVETAQIDILNIEETAQYLRISNQTVYNMIRDGRIRAFKVGREWRFLRADILSYMKSSSNQEIVAMAAKGGTISGNDLSAIQSAVEEADGE